MEDSKQFNSIAILGTGSIGIQYARLLIEGGCEPILISVRDKKRKELRTQGYKVAEDVCSSKADFCIIATETKRHVDDVIDAMKCGMKVLVEKPLGMNSNDVERLEEALSEEELFNLRVVSPLRWSAGVQKVSQNLTRLGKIHSVNIWCQSYLPDWRPERDFRESYSANREQGGVIRDLVHEIDYCNSLFGLPDSSKVQCVGGDGSAIGIKSTANAHLSWKGEGGELVSIQLDYLTRKPRRGMSVHGEFGECHVDLIEGVYREEIGDHAEEYELENDRKVAMRAMLSSFIKQDGLGCDFFEAKKAQAVIDRCEATVHG